VEQTVWLYVGIIAAIIGLGFVATIVLGGRETSHWQTVENGVKKMQQNCNQVCSSDVETMFSADVTLVSGMRLYATGRGICANYKDEQTCKECDCEVFDKEGQSFALDLTGATELFESNQYKCFMERTETGVAVECKG